MRPETWRPFCKNRRQGLVIFDSDATLVGGMRNRSLGSLGLRSCLMGMRLGMLGPQGGRSPLPRGCLCTGLGVLACRGAHSGWAIDETSGIWGPLLAASMFGPLVAAAVVRRVREVRVPTGWRPYLKGGRPVVPPGASRPARPYACGCFGLLPRGAWGLRPHGRAFCRRCQGAASHWQRPSA